MIAAILAVIGAVCYVVAMLGGTLGDADLGTLGHVFVALALAALAVLPWPWPRR